MYPLPTPHGQGKWVQTLGSVTVVKNREKIYSRMKPHQLDGNCADPSLRSPPRPFSALQWMQDKIPVSFPDLQHLN